MEITKGNESKEEKRLKQIRLRSAKTHSEKRDGRELAQKASTSFSEQGVCLQDIRKGKNEVKRTLQRYLLQPE